MILNIEAWQKPTSILEVAENIPSQEVENYEVRILGKHKFAPEIRTGVFLNFYSSDNILEGKLLELEKLTGRWKVAKPLEKIGIMSEYRDTAETYNLLVGFQCMETEITKLNIPLTNNSGKIVLNFV